MHSFMPSLASTLIDRYSPPGGGHTPPPFQPVAWLLAAATYFVARFFGLELPALREYLRLAKLYDDSALPASGAPFPDVRQRF